MQRGHPLGAAGGRPEQHARHARPGRRPARASPPGRGRRRPPRPRPRPAAPPGPDHARSPAPRARAHAAPQRAGRPRQPQPTIRQRATLSRVLPERAADLLAVALEPRAPAGFVASAADRAAHGERRSRPRSHGPLRHEQLDVLHRALRPPAGATRCAPRASARGPRPPAPLVPRRSPARSAGPGIAPPPRGRPPGDRRARSTRAVRAGTLGQPRPEADRDERSHHQDHHGDHVRASLKSSRTQASPGRPPWPSATSRLRPCLNGCQSPTARAEPDVGGGRSSGRVRGKEAI